METELLFLHDSYLRTATGRVVDSRSADRGIAVALDRTVFYPTGGGQPHDNGWLRWDGGEAAVVSVQKVGPVVWHHLHGPQPPADAEVHGEIDWDRRHALMRTHTALHILCGIIWHEWGKAVTGGNMEPLAARMDFEFDPLPAGFGPRVEELVNMEVVADRPIEVAFLDRDVAVADDALIRTKVNRIPESVREIRVVDIVGLDKQADGGTHVARTGEVGAVSVVKTESKGKAFKRIRIAVGDDRGR